MAHFYSSCQGRSGEASRLGGKESGVTTLAAGWEGAIRVNVWYDEEHDRNEFRVMLEPWQGYGFTPRIIAEGILDAKIEDPYIPALIA